MGDLTAREITLDEAIASKEALERPKDTAALCATREATANGSASEARAGRAPGPCWNSYARLTR